MAFEEKFCGAGIISGASYVCAGKNQIHKWPQIDADARRFFVVRCAGIRVHLRLRWLAHTVPLGWEGVRKKRLSTQFKPSSDAEIRESVGVVWDSSYNFLLGSKHCLQIDINLYEFLSATRQLRYRSRSSASRANLAVIEGILSTYEGQKIDCIGIRSAASAQAVTLFHRFAGLDDYRALSEAARHIGFPRHVKDATNSFSAISRDLVRSPELGESLEPGTRQ